MAKVRTQADRRQHAVLRDQHGRKFSCVIEKDTMRPCSSLTPKGWKPPLLFGKREFVPPEPYISYAKDDPFEMVIDYDSWIADAERELAAYNQQISAAAIMLFGSGATEAVRNRSPELMNYVGGPRMPVEPIKAAKKGNLFVLGLSEKMPPWAIPFFTKPEKEEESFPDAEDDYPDVEDLTAAIAQDDDNEFPNVEEPADTVGLLTDPDFEAAIELEEIHDPKATGGTSVDPRAAARHIPLQKPPKPKPKAKASR